MPFVDDIAGAAAQTAQFNVGAFYGSAAGLSPGAGVIFSKVQFPIFNPTSARYEVRNGCVLVLTHECDIDQTNVRDFNTEVLVAPILLMEALANRYDFNEDRRQYGKSLVAAIGAGSVQRMMYLPPHVSPLENGGVLHFNAITSIHVSLLNNGSAQAICALSEYGMSFVDRHLTNHLFRPKEEQLARLF